METAFWQGYFFFCLRRYLLALVVAVSVVLLALGLVQLFMHILANKYGAP